MEAETPRLVCGRGYFDCRICQRNFGRLGSMGYDWILGASQNLSCILGVFDTTVDKTSGTLPASEIFSMSQISVYCGWLRQCISCPYRAKKRRLNLCLRLCLSLHLLISGRRRGAAARQLERAAARKGARDDHVRVMAYLSAPGRECVCARWHCAGAYFCRGCVRIALQTLSRCKPR